MAIVGMYPALQTANADLPQFERVRVLPSPKLIDDAELTDQDGDAFQLSELDGRVVFVFFGFTNCPDVCPQAMQRLRVLHRSRELSLDDVAYVLISVDGERDTPEQMKSFLEEYSEDFIGLTDEPENVRRIASDFKTAFYKGSEDRGGGYQVTHSPQIYLLDAKRRLRAELYNAPLESMIGIANALIDEKTNTHSSTGR
jgi:protein SCO1/2